VYDDVPFVKYLLPQNVNDDVPLVKYCTC